MTRIALPPALCFGMSVAASAKDEAPPYPTNFTDDGAGVKDRIGQYLQKSVITQKMRACWSELPGQGAIAVDLNYRKAGDKWMFEKASVTKSSLEKGQETLAQRCVDDAAQETSFAVDAKDGLETAAPQFVVRLGWPVPLPPEGAALTDAQVARMVGGSGGGGVITVPGCSTCVKQTEYPGGYKCESRASGSDKDCEEINRNLCATTPTACLRGVVGGSRGVIMY